MYVCIFLSAVDDSVPENGEFLHSIPWAR